MSSSSSGITQPDDNTTLQVKVGLKLVLSSEKNRRALLGENVSMNVILAEIMAEKFKGNAEYMKLIEATGLLD